MTRRRRNVTTGALLVAVTLAMGSAVSACDATHGGGSASGGTANGVGKPDAVPGSSGALGSSDTSGDGAAKSGDASLPQGDALAKPLAQPALDARSVIYTGSMSIEARDVRAAANNATHLVQAAGGVLFDATYTSGQPTPLPLPQPDQTGASGTTPTTGPGAEAGEPVAVLTYKLPPARFTTVVTALREVGNVVSEQQDAQDVTARVVDLTSRVDTARRSVARVRALLDKATSIGDVVQVEGELSRREASLESLEGQLRVLDSQTALATLTVQITTPSTHPAAVPHPHRTGFVAGLLAGWHGFLRSVTAVVTVLGAVLPFAVLALALAALALWVRRLWHGSRRTPPTVTPDGAP